MEMIKKINYVLNRKQKITLLIVAVLVLIGAFLELLGVSAIMPLIDVVSDPNKIHTNSYYKLVYNFLEFENENDFISFMVVAIVVIYVLKNIYMILMYDIQYRFTFNNQYNLSSQMMDCYMRQPYLFHVSTNISELYRNVTADTAMFFGAVLGIIQIATETCVCVLLGLFLFLVDKSITIGILCLLSCFLTIFFKLFKSESERLGNLSRDISTDMGKWIRQSFEGIKEIKIMNRELVFEKRVNKYFTMNAVAQRKFNWINSLPKPVFEAACISALMGIILIKHMSGVSLSHLISTLSVFAVASFRLLPSFGRFAGLINTLNYNKAGVYSVYNDLVEIESLMDDTKHIESSNDTYCACNSIVASNVWFKYPSIDEYVLENVSLRIEKNESVAFIGPSGSGKTTLADIILGILKPNCGSILVDGENIEDIMGTWHNSLGYIPQTIYLMDDTIRNNILFGVEDKSDEQILKALEDAQLKQFVEDLPEGLNTYVGERGIRLSGGQRQRIGIARALYRNPKVLVLDEATSALDNDTESAVMDAINHLRGKKTMIIIAHRLSTIENCDAVYEVRERTVIRKR